MEQISERKRKSPKRIAIIEAATTAFLEKGYGDTSMDYISESAKVSKRTVYDHFPSKQDLFQAIVDEVLERVDKMPKYTYSEEKELNEQLFDIGMIFVETITEEKFIKLSKVVVSHFIQAPEWTHNTITAHSKTRRNMLHLFEEATKAKKLKMKNIDFAAAQFCGLIKELIFWPELMAGQKSATKKEKEMVVQSAVDLFLSHYEK